MSHIDDLAAFVGASPSSFHAARQSADRLVADGFTELDERQPWSLQPGGFVVVRDGSFIAFRVPDAPDGFRIVGAHTDSPGFKVKPEPLLWAAGWRQVGVEVYGGPLPNSWLDRELGIAGRVVTRSGVEHLVRTPAWLRIAQLAIHLDRSQGEKLALDRQHHLQPVFGIGAPVDVLDLVANEAGVEPGEVAGHDLFAYVAQPPEVFGPQNDLFASGRLDNLSSVHAGLRALQVAEPGPDVQLLACFDHEEVGSASATGAAGAFLETVLSRIAASLGRTAAEHAAALARSTCVSADAGHAVHPNYAHLHDPAHRPLLNRGPLLKTNANQRYATDALGAAMWRRACAEAGVPTQTFVSNNDVPCGSTIGPITATRLGIRTVDVGIPLLSMHSARELAGAHDPGYLAAALGAYLSGA